jgi:hypothetical protein
MKTGFFARNTGLSRDPIEEVSTPLRPAPPLAKRLNRNALTVAAVIMGMTVLTAIVLLNPAKESKATRAASENAENSPPVPARPVFLDEPLPRSVPPAPTDSGSPTTQPAVTTGAVKSAFYPPSAPSGTAPENSVTREGSSPAMAESPRKRAYQAALMSSAVSGVTRSESASNPAADSRDTPTEEQQLVTLGDSIMRSALRQSGPLPGPALSGDGDRSTGLPIAGASHQSFATKAAEAAAKTATHAQLTLHAPRRHLDPRPSHHRDHFRSARRHRRASQQRRVRFEISAYSPHSKRISPRRNVRQPDSRRPRTPSGGLDPTPSARWPEYAAAGSPTHRQGRK